MLDTPTAALFLCLPSTGNSQPFASPRWRFHTSHCAIMKQLGCGARSMFKCLLYLTHNFGQASNLAIPHWCSGRELNPRITIPMARGIEPPQLSSFDTVLPLNYHYILVEEVGLEPTIQVHRGCFRCVQPTFPLSYSSTWEVAGETSLVYYFRKMLLAAISRK